MFQHDDPPLGTWMWHIHHDTLAEPLAYSLAERLDFIRRRKPQAEVATRLALIHPVDTSLLDLKAYAAWTKAHDVRMKAYVAWIKIHHDQDDDDAAVVLDRAKFDAVYVAYVKADDVRIAASMALWPSLEAIHTTSCPGLTGIGTCPWDGHTIFPEASA